MILLMLAGWFSHFMAILKLFSRRKMVKFLNTVECTLQCSHESVKKNINFPNLTVPKSFAISEAWDRKKCFSVFVAIIVMLEYNWNQSDLKRKTNEQRQGYVNESTLNAQKLQWFNLYKTQLSTKLLNQASSYHSKLRKFHERLAHV